MIFSKTALLFLAAVLIFSTGCSKEPSGTEGSLKSDTVIITPSFESSSPETTSASVSEPSSEVSSAPEISASESGITSETSSLPETSSETEITSEKEYGTLILVNPWNYIPDDYVPDLEQVQGKYNLDKKAAESARNLLAAAKKAGYNMQLCSAYRTVEKSAELYKHKVNEFIGYG